MTPEAQRTLRGVEGAMHARDAVCCVLPVRLQKRNGDEGRGRRSLHKVEL